MLRVLISSATPRRGSLLCAKKMVSIALAAGAMLGAWADGTSVPVKPGKFYEEADDRIGLNLAAWECYDWKDVAFWIGYGISMAIPVDEDFTASDIKLIAGTYSSYGTPRVVSDEWLYAKHYTALKNAVGEDPYEDYEYDEGAYGLVYEDDVRGRNYSLSLDIWPDREVVPNRKWILLEMGGKPTSGCKTFYLGIKGRDDDGYSRFRIYEAYEVDDGEVFGIEQDPDDWADQRELAVLPVPIGGGTTSGSGLYRDGTTVTLTAKPTFKTRFVKWSDGETSATREVTVAGDAHYFAVFAERDPSEYTFEVIAGNKVDVDVELLGYTVKGLPNGLKYVAKTGKVTGAAKAAGEYDVTFSKKGEEDVTLTFRVRAENVSVGCVGLSSGVFTAGVVGNADGIPLEIESETGVKSVSVTKLPAGMKYDAKKGLITGAPTKAGDYAVVVTVTTQSGAKRTETIAISVAALPDSVVGNFNGFVKAVSGEENMGTFQLTATDAGKLTAKVVMAAGQYSFSGTCWDKVENGVYSVAFTTKKGDRLELALDSTAGWNENQVTGRLAAGSSNLSRDVVARRNAFGKTWSFVAEGDIVGGWTLSYAANAKVAHLTVTLNADGSTKIAGKLGTLAANGKIETLSANASGYADVTGLANGVIYADFAPVVSVKEGKSTLKRTLSIRTNLWFDRSDDHLEGVGTAKVLSE